MDSANGFCLPESALFLIIKKAKPTFSSSFFYNFQPPDQGLPHHLSASSRERSPSDQTLMLLSKGKWAASAAVTYCCPWKLETVLKFQTYLLLCITKLAVLPDPCKCLFYMRVVKAWEAGEQGEGICVWKGAPPAWLSQLLSIEWFWRWNPPEEEEGAPGHLVSHVSRQTHIPMHSWNNKGSCEEAARYPRQITRTF